MINSLKYLKEEMAIKNKYTLLSIVLFLALAAVDATICVAEKVARYAASQDEKQVFLAEIREDVSVLTSCLQPQASTSSVAPENASKVVPSLNRTSSHK